MAKLVGQKILSKQLRVTNVDLRAQYHLIQDVRQNFGYDLVTNLLIRHPLNVCQHVSY